MRAGMALAGIVGFFLALPGAAGATFPGENGRILFISDAINDLTSAFPGSSATPVVADGYGIGEYSSDGTQVVYSVERHVDGCGGGDECPGQQEIYIANADGSGEAPLTYTSASEVDPSIHPSGEEIAFGRDEDLFQMNLTNGNVNLLVQNGRRPRYSPDGDQIVFTRDSDDAEDVFIMDADGSNVRNLTQTGDVAYSSNSTWSPDGETVYYDSFPLFGSDSEIKSIPASSTGGSGIETIGQGAWPLASPDGQMIAFANQDAGRRIYTMSIEGTGAALVGPTAVESFVMSWQAVASAASSTVGDGGSVSTGAEASPAEPGQASVTTLNSGTVSIAVNPFNGPVQDGFASVGQRFDIAAPNATVEDPLVLVFLLDASTIPLGETAASLEVFRNGAVVGDCPGASDAIPDPCVTERSTLVDGDVSLTVLSSQASTWDVAVGDQTKPTTKLKKPPKKTKKRSLAIKFSSSEEGSTFKCTLDGESRPCVSPYLTAKLKFGKHNFSVTATDAAGNKDDSPAKAKFEIVKK